MSRNVSLKSIEDFPKRIKLFFLIIISVLLIGTIGFGILNGFDFNAGFIRTLQTLSFIFNEEAILLERLLEIFLALIGVFCIWWVLWSIADMLLEGNLTNYLKNKFYFNTIMGMKEHFVIVGGGRTGQEIARELTQKNKPFVIIEIDEIVVKELKKKNFFVIHGDAQSEKILDKANIKSAKKIIIVTPKNETNLLIILTAKEMNNNIKIVTRAEKQLMISKLKRAGANSVIIPEILTGKKIVEEIDL